MKVVNSKKPKKNISGFVLGIALVGLIGYAYGSKAVDEVKDYSNDLKISTENAKRITVDVPDTKEEIQFKEKVSENTDVTYQYLDIEDLKKYGAYLVYKVDNGNVYYDVQFLDEVIDKDYIAYYKSLDGDLEALDSDGDAKLSNSEYLKYDVVYLGNVYDDLTNSELSEVVSDSINYEDGTMTRKGYILYELGYISRHKDQVNSEVDKIRERTR